MNQYRQAPQPVSSEIIVLFCLDYDTLFILASDHTVLFAGKSQRQLLLKLSDQILTLTGMIQWFIQRFPGHSETTVALPDCVTLCAASTKALLNLDRLVKESREARSNVVCILFELKFFV